MATRTITVDDLTGKETLTATRHEVTFAVWDKKEKSYVEVATAELDLSGDSAKAIKTWLVTGDTRELAGLLPRRIRIDGGGDNSETATIRTWAKAQDQFKDTVKDRGALPEDVIEAYRKAHPTPPAS